MEQQDFVYKLSINFNYDSVENKIIETRCIKRNSIASSSTQLLKGNLLEYTPENSQTIYQKLIKKPILIFEKVLSKEEVKLVLDKAFHLFDDINKVISNKDLENLIG